MKEIRRRILGLFSISCFLVSILMGCGFGHTRLKAVADLSGLPYLEETIYAPDNSYIREVVQGVAYEEYALLDMSLNPEDYCQMCTKDTEEECPISCSGQRLEEYSRGELYAYYVNDDRYMYFCQIEGLNPEEWLVRIPDDRTGHFSDKEVFVVKAVGVTDIPSWIEDAKKVSMEYENPGSYSGLEAGFTIIES